MTPRFFDIHTHLNDKTFHDDREAVIGRMHTREVWGIVVGTDYKSSQDAITIASFSGEGIFATIGIHPSDKDSEKFREHFFEELVREKNVVAIGECGLDYSHMSGISDSEKEKARQKKLFEDQIDFAITHDLPLMIHCRDSDKSLKDAHLDTLAIFREKKKSAGERLRGNIHFFSQTIDIAREYFELGFTISFTGVITFSREYDEVVRESPREFLMVETDCPYVTPVPHRGTRNEPVYVEEVVKKIAEIRGEDYELLRASLVQNALRVFEIKR